MAFVLTKNPVTFVLCVCFIVHAHSAVTADTSDVKPKDSKTIKIDNVPHCDYNREDFNVCIGKFIDAMILRATDVGIQSLDPFVLNRTTFQYSHQAASGRLTVKNALVYGFSKGYHTKIDTDIAKNGKTKLHAILNIPKLEMIGNYKATIQLNNVQLKPKGPFNLTLSDVIVESWFDAIMSEKDGHRSLFIEEFKSEPKANAFNIEAKGIFDDPELNAVALEVLNTTWRQLFATMLPETRKYWVPMIVDLMNKALNVLPLETYIDNLPALEVKTNE